ncbi:MAG TPA: hypothetical protein DCL77_03055 [Prolixibacteraceae bacterium]|jgi:hypothetical protein|nr:hypothetical protein [Prolixibacteraceae bacterium]
MLRKISITAIVSFLFLSSCVTLNEFPIEVFQPAKVTLPAEIKHVTLFNRNMKYLGDTLQNYYSNNYRRIRDIIPINIDSMSVRTCFDSLSMKMQAQKRFNKITVLPVTSLPVQYVKNITPPSKKLIQKISTDTNADALILLDTYSSYYTVYPNHDEGHTIAKVITASIWTIYDASKVQIINHSSLVDTLYWDGLDSSGNYSSTRIPNKKAAMKIAAGMVGVKYSKNIVPSWTTVYRQTLSCNEEDFKKAAELAKKNKWDDASALWEKYTESPSKRFQMLALYNLAVASEMNGDIESATELISRASKISSSNNIEKQAIRKYSAILAKRKIELNKINSMSYDL